MIRLIAIDLDGTLLRDDKSIAPRVASAVRACVDRGAKVVIASARPPRSVRAIYAQLGLDTPQVNYNGALLWDEPTRTVLDHRPIQASVASSLIASARDLAPEVLVSCEILDRWHTDRVDPAYLTASAKLMPPDVIAPVIEYSHLDVTKLMFQGPPAMMDLLAANLFNASIKLTRTDPDLLQYMHQSAGKGAGLTRVCERLSVAMSDVLAIGDNHNDIDMLALAGIGVAMGHAQPSVCAMAHHVVPTNEEDGVAVALETLFLNNG